MYNFDRIPKHLHPKFIEHYENEEMQECFKIITEYYVNDQCQSCNNLYELKIWVEWALKNGVLLRN